jgi:pentatricopeptide repeat protein
MIQQSKDRGLFRPNAVTLNTMLAIFSKAAALNKNNVAIRNAAAGKAKSLLNQWQQYYEKRLVSQRADLVSFNTVITTLGKANLYQEAEEVFHQSGREGFAPDIITYNALIKAFAMAGKDRESRKHI